MMRLAYKALWSFGITKDTQELIAARLRLWLLHTWQHYFLPLQKFTVFLTSRCAGHFLTKKPTALHD